MKFRVKYNPHSDLANLAQYQLDAIEAKKSSNDTAGIGLDMQACLISHAFLAEALINMAGFGLYRDEFKEREPFPLKRKKVLTALSIEHIKQLGYVLDELQCARNALAHAKPERYEVILEAHEDEFAVFNRPHDKLLNIEFLRLANKVLDELWYVIGNNALVEEYGTVTTAVEVG